MKTFTNLEEMQPYYNENTDTYEFIENQKMLDVEFNFDLNIDRSIRACNIKACNIKARDIKAWDIKACNIKARDIYACDIKARNIDACYIQASNIQAYDIEFCDICFSYKTFVCNTIKGRHEKSRYFTLDGDVVINKKEY